MTSRSWNEIGRLFAKARSMDSAKRCVYLQRACRNASVRHEVETLLEQYDKGENLLGVFSSVGGKVLSHYEVFEPIGAGGQALVYRARDTRLNRWVALKVLQHWAMGHTGFKKRLIQEAQLASRLNHPNIVTIHDIAEENGVCFIVMEHVPGKSLDAVIGPKGLPIQETLHYARQIVDALSAAESAGVLHGDLKPANIMVSDDGHIKLLDFGLATALSAGQDPRQDAASARFGTKPYMAPERLRNLQLNSNSRSEIFSFGLILYQMLSGRHAFGAGGDKAVSVAIQKDPPAPLPAKVPAGLARLVRRCLDKTSGRRFKSLNELLYALQKCASLKKRRTSVQQVDSARPVSSSAVVQTRRARSILDRLSYRNVARSHESLAALGRLLEDGPLPRLRRVVALGLRTFILSTDFGSSVPMPPVRELRRATLQIMKTAVGVTLGSLFQNRELEHLDLFGMDFTGSDLHDVSFKGCFLVEANFRKCNIAQASFRGAYIRNVDFTDADLNGADLTDADWFNAIGIRFEQLRLVAPTLLDCPPNVPAMRRYLKNRYGFPFESWETRAQEELKATWAAYLRSGGLREALLRR